jgi:hypothetical protein
VVKQEKVFSKELTMGNSHNRHIGKITFPFEFLFFILSLCIPISLSAQQTAKPTDVNNLLELSVASYESLPPYSMHIETEISYSIPHDSIDGEVCLFEKRYDNGRLDVLWKTYEVTGQEKELVYDKRAIWTGEQYQFRQQYVGSKGTPEDQRILAWGSYKEDNAKHLLIDPYSGSFMSGFMMGDSQHVCNILKQSGVAKLHAKTETVGDNACYMVEGKTQSGTYKIWIDPDSGFSVTKAIVNKQIGDLYYDRPITAKSSDKKVLIGHEISMSDVEVGKTGEYYIPISANLIHKYKYSDGTTVQVTWSSTKSKIQLKPNFEQMGAFVMDGIPEGTRLTVDERPGLDYIWADGRFLLDAGLDAVEEIDKATQQIISNGDVPSKLGTINRTETVDGEPNTVGNTQANDSESQPDILSESRSFPVQVFILIGLVIIGVVAWGAYRLKGR